LAEPQVALDEFPSDSWISNIHFLIGNIKRSGICGGVALALKEIKTQEIE
jgi:hypothetical protein